MASKNLDGICFPSCKILTPKFDDLRSEKWTVLTFPTNTVVASQSLLPSICIPAGFSNENIPVGMEIISYRQSEKNLLQIAYSIESYLRNRRAPNF
jgi:Asp-tRNA(Asn)/Glu-tRNA(Gln) amidotransferase A subunit family amidase